MKIFVTKLCITVGFLFGIMSLVFAASPSVKTWVSNGYRYIEGNGIPNHGTGQFPNAHNPNSISEQNHRYRVTATPSRNSSATPIGMSAFGVAINGIPFDPGAAEYWDNNPQSGWQYEALSHYVQLGMDHNHAHVQPNGSYHYHGIPTGLITTPHSPLVGYAADGFPIYSQSNSGVTELKSSYQLKTGTRPNGPGGNYDGRFVNDYEFRAGSGDLDQCNGRTGITPEYPAGTYYYVLTETFPFIPRCWVGTPDPSFLRSRNMGMGPPRDKPMGPQAMPPQQMPPPMHRHPHGHPPGPPPR